MNNNKFDIAIIGGGMSGFFTAKMLGKYTNMRIGLFEQGPSYYDRQTLIKKDNEYQLKGIGGAGTLNGGKLCSYPASGKVWTKTRKYLRSWENFVSELPLNSTDRKTLVKRTDSFVSDPAKIEPFYLKKYNTVLLLTERMRSFVNSLVMQTENNGVEIYANSLITDIEENTHGFNLKVKANNDYFVSAKYVIIATGRVSANNLKGMLKKTPVKIIEQSPDLGIRMELPKKHSPLFSQPGRDTKIKMNINGYNLRTFCVCSGGNTATVNIDSIEYADGHFEDLITDKISLGIMSRTNSIVGYDMAIEYCKGLLYNGISYIDLSDFLKCNSKLIKEPYRLKFADTICSINIFIRELLKRGILENDISECKVVFPSIDRYNLLIETNSSFETNCQNLFIIGDAAGISRGYLQSLWAGWCSSNSIIMKDSYLEKYGYTKTKLEYAVCT